MFAKQKKKRNKGQHGTDPWPTKSLDMPIADSIVSKYYIHACSFLLLLLALLSLLSLMSQLSRFQVFFHTALLKMKTIADRFVIFVR